MLEIEISNAEILSTTVIAASSSQVIAVNGALVRFCVDGKSLWYKFGTDNTVSATTGSSSEGYVPAGFPLDVPIPRGKTHVAIIQAAATAVGSVQMIG